MLSINTGKHWNRGKHGYKGDWHISYFIPPEIVEKPLAFWYFQGVWNILVRNGSAKSQEFVLNIFQIFVFQIMCEFSGFNSYGKLHSKNFLLITEGCFLRYVFDSKVIYE